MHFSFVSTLALVASVSATTVTLFNNCTSQVDPAFFAPVFLGSAPAGGFPLTAKTAQLVTLPANYSGRVWGRTGCNSAGVCATGQCFQGGENCTSPAPAGPTLAQFTINGYAALDFFNPTAGEGFNLKVTIIPGRGCSTAPVSCNARNSTVNGCSQTTTCPTGTNYTVQFC